jgi:hypothetical protein
LTPASLLANTVTLMGEEIFARNSVRDDGNCVYLPLVKR